MNLLKSLVEDIIKHYRRNIDHSMSSYSRVQYIKEMNQELEELRKTYGILLTEEMASQVISNALAK